MMMRSYIKELLYRYDCVIVPNFGGFVTNTTNTQLVDGIFYPPTKKISFNAQLQHNDGLLANEVASVLNISFEEAVAKILETVAEWKETLKVNTLEINEVGSLTLNEESQLVFKPNTTTNFLTSSFGFSPVNYPVIERVEEKVIPLPTVTSFDEEKMTEEEKSTKKPFRIVKYAAAAAILLAGTFGLQQFNKSNNNNAIGEQNLVEEKIQQATFVIDDQLPTISLDIAKEDSDATAYIIAGAFQLEENALKKITELKSKGYDAKILGKNQWGLTQVSVGSYASKDAAKEVIEKVREEASKDAWILVK